LSPSGNVHGMPVACLCGFGPRELVEIGGRTPAIDPSCVRQIGVRSVDSGEKRFVHEQGLDVFDMRHIDEMGMRNTMEQALTGLDSDTHLHVSFDVDFLDPEIAPGVGTTVPGGPTYREAQLCMEMIADTHRLASLDVVELGSRPFNLVVCDSPTFSRGLRDLALKRTLCIRQASALSEQLLLKPCELCGVKFLDAGLDLALLVGLWIRERVVHCLRYVRFAAFRALPVQPRKLSDAHLSSEHVDVFAIVRLDLRRITHVHLVSGPMTAYKLTVM